MRKLARDVLILQRALMHRSQEKFAMIDSTSVCPATLALIAKAKEVSEYLDGFKDEHARKLGAELYAAASAVRS